MKADRFFFSLSGKMQMSYKGMFDLLTPAVSREFPWPSLRTGCCVGPHAPLIAGTIRKLPSSSLKGTVIELSSKWQYLLTWNTHILPIGVGVGSETEEGLHDAAVVQRKNRPGSFVAQEGWGSCLKGLFSSSHAIVPWKRQGLYLLEAAGGWWGANLLRGCVIGGPVPNSLLAVRTVKQAQFMGPWPRLSRQCSRVSKHRLDTYVVALEGQALTPGSWGDTPTASFEPSSWVAAPSVLFCKHYKLAICIWMGSQPIQEAEWGLRVSALQIKFNIISF